MGGAAIDHVLLAVDDLPAAAARLTSEHGLTVFPGGRHPGAGTANQLVPLGPDYLELIAVVDAAEAAQNPLSRRVTAALERGSGIATWAVRAGDLETARARLEAAGVATFGPRAGSRRRPDGSLLEWRTLHAGDGLEPAIPFFIEWSVAPGDHPGARPVAHPAGFVALKGLRLRSPDPGRLRARLAAMLGEDLATLSYEVGDREEVAAVLLDVHGREVELTGA